jgi:surfeit locus 1 family protein
VWQNLVLARYREATKLDLHAFVIQQTDGPDDGFVRQWRSPDLGRDKHLAYAFQWYALALAIFIYFLATHVRRNP